MSKPKLNKIQLVTLVALVAMSAISTDLYLSGLPQMVEDFDSTHSKVQLTLSFFLIGLAIGQMIAGPLADQHGRLPVLKVGLTVYVVASIGCLLVSSVESLWAARFLQGLAASCGPVLARAIVSDLFTRKEAAKILAYLASAMALIPAIAPILGSVALIWFDWTSHFVLLAIFGLLLLVAVFKQLPETYEPQPNRSFKQSLSFIFSNINKLLGNRIYLGYVACGTAANSAMFAYISSAAYLVSGLLGVAPEYFGYTFTVNCCGYIIGAFISAKMVSRTPIVTLLGVGICLLIIVVILLLIQQAITLPGLLFAMALVFTAGGFLIANAQAAAISRFKDCAGAASAVFGFIQISIAAISGAVAGLLYNDTILPLTLIIGFFAIVGAVAWYFLLFKSTEKASIHG